MRRGLHQFTIAKHAPEGTRVHADDPDIDRWENEGGRVGNSRGLVVKPRISRPMATRL